MRPITVKIKREKRTEFATALEAPARIITRRKTAACDETVELEHILDPLLQPIEPFETGKPAPPARIIARRNTLPCEVIVDHEQEQYEESGGNDGSRQIDETAPQLPPKSANNMEEDLMNEAAGTSARSL